MKCVIIAVLSPAYMVGNSVATSYKSEHNVLCIRNTGPILSVIHTTTFRGICCVALLLIVCDFQNQPITDRNSENRMQLVKILVYKFEKVNRFFKKTQSNDKKLWIKIIARCYKSMSHIGAYRNAVVSHNIKAWLFSTTPHQSCIENLCRLTENFLKN